MSNWTGIKNEKQEQETNSIRAGGLILSRHRLGTGGKEIELLACRPARAVLRHDDQGGYRLAVELQAQLPGIHRDRAQRIMEEAHKTCPYSKALRGDTSVKLVVD